MRKNVKTKKIFINNDEALCKSSERINDKLIIINDRIVKTKSSGSTSFEINEDGRIVSVDNYYNNRLFIEVLINEAGLSYFDQDFTVIFDNNGYKETINNEIYVKYPQLEQDFIAAGEDFIGTLDNKEVAISFKGNKFYVNDIEFPLFAQTKGYYYEEFKSCVGYWWFLPGVNIVTCGAGAIIARVIDYDEVYEDE